MTPFMGQRATATETALESALIETLLRVRFMRRNSPMNGSSETGRTQTWMRVKQLTTSPFSLLLSDWLRSRGDPKRAEKPSGLVRAHSAQGRRSTLSTSVIYSSPRSPKNSAGTSIQILPDNFEFLGGAASIRNRSRTLQVRHSRQRHRSEQNTQYKILP